MLYNNMLELVGNTPLVKINKLNQNPDVEVYAKLERFNPLGSVKERIALYMIEEAEREGTLTKDKIIIEPSSGNTGIGLAFAGAVKGYKVTIVMPESMSIERRRILKAFGADIILTPAEEGMDGAILRARELAKDPRYFMPDQFKNRANVLAHYKTTAEEIWRDTQGKITHFVAGMGTTGTLMGVSKRLKELNPNIKIIAVEPYPKHSIQGLKNMDEQINPDIYDPKAIDDKINVHDSDAIEMARKLAKYEGMFVGMSSGAAMHIALEYAKKLDSGLMVVLLPDGGEKYLSTKLFSKYDRNSNL
ncbi:MAG: cysteine synthase family protein [Candidatus Diapherotrites archaeon]|nr:cysteine synthase family protein [Candidatus Diapherotrites archaeon]